MRIAFITASRIGDAVLNSGILDHALRVHPEARVTIACGAPAAPLFEDCPAVERIIRIVKRPRNRHWIDLWRALSSTRWDQVIDLRGSALAWLLIAAERRAPRPRRRPVHRVIELQRAFGLTEPPAPRIWLGEARRHAAAAMLGADRPVLALAPTANWPGKQWPVARWIALAERLITSGGHFERARILVVGAPGEREAARDLMAALPADRLIDGFAIGDLLTVAAAIARADLFIGNDSGLMHIAAATGAPTLGLFGPSDDRRYAPWGARAALVRSAEPHDLLIRRVERDPSALTRLMDGIEVSMVMGAVETLLASRPQARAGTLVVANTAS